jgi:starch synthase
MACGLPVIAPRMLGPTSIVDDGETGWLVAPDDESELARTLAEVIDDPRERERRGTLARQAALERFSWPSIAGDLASVLERVAGAETVAA